MPEVAKTASHVTVYQRTPQWIIARDDYAIQPLQKALLSIPFFRNCKRSLMMFYREATHDPIVKADSKMADEVRKMGIEHIKKGLPDKPEMWDVLTPKYAPGCRRILSSDDYYPALNKEHVKLETRDIQRITESGIQTADETTEFDLIVYATGFRTVEFLTPIKIHGANGRDLAELWDGGATAYYGVTAEDMPNFGLLYGPNTNLGTFTILFKIRLTSRPQLDNSHDRSSNPVPRRAVRPDHQSQRKWPGNGHHAAPRGRPVIQP